MQLSIFLFQFHRTSSNRVSSKVQYKYPKRTNFIMSKMSLQNPRSMSLNLRKSRGAHHDTTTAHNCKNLHRDYQPNSYMLFPRQRIKQFPQQPKRNTGDQKNYQQPRIYISPEQSVGAFRRRDQDQRVSEDIVENAGKRQSSTTVDAKQTPTRGQGRKQGTVYERDIFGNKYRVYGQNNFSYGSRTAFRKQNTCETCCSCILAACCCCCGGAMLYGAT